MTVEWNPEAIMGPIQESFAPALLKTVAKAIEYAPVGTGELRRSIIPRLAGPTEGQIIAASSHAMIVEEGSRAHTIAPIRKKALAGKGFGPVAGPVSHPGTKGDHFMSRAIVQFKETYAAELKTRLGI